MGAIAQTVVARFLVAGINVATGIICARVLNANGRGELTAILVWPGLLAYLLTLGIPSAVRFWIKKEPERRSEFFTIAVIGAALASLLAILIGFVCLPFWLHGYAPDVVHAAQILMWFSPEIMLGLIFTAMLEALGAFTTANVTRYVTVLLTLVGLIALALTHRLTPFTGALVYTSGPVIVSLWIAWHLRSHFVLRRFDAGSATRALASYGVRSYGIDVLNVISTQVDQVLVIAFLSASNVGIYVVALNASRIVNILHTAVVSVVFPTAAGNTRDRVLGMVERSARVSTLIAVVFGAALAVALPILIPLFYGNGFAAGIVVAQLLTLEAVIGGLVSVLAQSFMALDRPGTVTILQGLGLAIVVPLMVLLLPHFGLIGAAGALVISTTCRLGLMLASYPLILKAPLPSLLPLAADFAQVRAVVLRR